MFLKKLLGTLKRQREDVQETVQEQRKGETKRRNKKQTEEKNVLETEMKTEDTPQSVKNQGKLFVGGLSQLTTSKKLETYFSQFGKVIDAVVIRFPETGKSRGFGFVTFMNPTIAESALRSKPHLLDGKSVDIKPFFSGELLQKSSKLENELKVFIGGLPPDISTGTVKEFFGRYGEVTDVIIPKNRGTNKPKGFGFVKFNGEESVEKCLAENFIYLGGRRICIRRADPRDRSQVRKAIELGEVCKEENDRVTQDSRLRYLDEKSSSLSDVCGTSSTASEIEKYSHIYELFQDYFTAKYSDLYRMDGKGNERESNNVKDMESLLEEYVLSSNVLNTTFGEDLINFSDDSEFEETSDVSDKDAVDCDYDGSVSDEKDSVSDELSVKLNEILSSFNAPEDLGLKKVLETGSGHTVGGRQEITTVTPVKFRNSAGSLFCSLCQWTAQENSFESFLTHCKTPAHKVKLRERFIKRNPESEETEQGVRKPVADQVPATVIQKNSTKKQTQTRKNPQEPKGEKAVSNGKNKVKKTKAKPQSEEEKSEEKNETTSDINDKGKNLNLKMVALANGMSYIRPYSGNKLQCSMCNKHIPPAPDISVLMKNVSCHLQSKTHLKKLLDTEVALMASLEQKKENKKKKQVKASVPEPPSAKQNVQGKTPGSKETLQKKEELLQNNNILKSVDKTPKILFLCIPCNFFNKNPEIFKNHLKSTSHLDCFTSKGISSDISFDNLTKCKSCGLYLYGSLYYINKHYSKCSPSTSANNKTS